MVQNLANSFLEASLNVSRSAAKNANALTNQNASFNDYMKQTDKARNDKQTKDVKKDAPNQKNDKPSTDAPKADKPLKDEIAQKPAEEETPTNEAPNELMVDLAMIAQMLVAQTVPQEQTPVVLPTEIASNAENQVVNAAANLEVVSEVAPEVKTVEVTQKPETAVKTPVNEEILKQVQTETEQPKELQKTVETLKSMASTEVKENTGEKQVKNTETQALTDAKPQEGAKPTQVKVTVNTGNTDNQSTAQTDTPDDAQMAVAKDIPEMPTITVKVGDAGQLNANQMAKDVAEAIINKLPQKPNEFEIQMNPKDLGKITIKLVFENGQTLVSLSANNAKTLGLLSECAKNIGVLIQQHTGNEAVVTVDDNNKAFNDQQKQQGNRDNAESQQQENAEKQKQKNSASHDFVQQMRLGLLDFDYSNAGSRFY